MHKLALSLLLLMGPGNAAGAEENQAPPTPVEDAARQFRVLTYDLFRTNRTEFDARRAAADELLAAWNQAQQPREHRQLVAGWFIEAAALTRQDLTAALPSVPQLPRTAKVSRTMIPPLDSAATDKSRAYLDPEAIQALNEASGRSSSADDAQDPSSMSIPMSNILNGLKRVVLGDE